MPHYRVFVTRDCTETAEIVVEADSVEEANEKALRLAQQHPQACEWDFDEGNECNHSPYLPDPESTEEIE